MKAKTAFQKITEARTVKILPDGRMVLSLSKVWCHEITTPNAIIEAQANDCDVVFNPNKIFGMIDHVSPAKDTPTAIQGQMIRQWTKKHGINFFDIGRNGVCHVIIPQYGLVMPGDIGIIGDSHGCTHGAFCAFTAGVGTTDLGNGIRTGLWICPPQKVIRVEIFGELPANIFAKDVILRVIQKIGVKGATNCIFEFTGEVVSKMSMEARMTLTNMAVEAGATSGMINADQTTADYLWPILKERHGYTSQATALVDLKKWNSDSNCSYDGVVTIDVSNMKPLITQNYSPSDVVPVSKLDRKHIDQVYIGSCTNGRIEDLRIAAACFAYGDVPVVEGTRCIVNPGSEVIWDMALREGLLEVFKKAGCTVTNPSCGACLGMSCGVIAPGEVALSTTNRNFAGRMGKGGMVHLASPATAAVTAMSGVISEPVREAMEIVMTKTIKGTIPATAIPIPLKTQEVKPIDFADYCKEESDTSIDFSGKACYLERDGETTLANDVNTDEIIPAKYLTEVDKDVFGEHCFEDLNMSVQSSNDLTCSQIIVAGENFGSGSSREHAVWALKATGIKCVIATSFARIFYNNMFNNGMLCIELTKTYMATLARVRPTKISINLGAGRVSWHDSRANGHRSFKLTEEQRELIRSGGSMNYMFKLAAEIQAQAS